MTKLTVKLDAQGTIARLRPLVTAGIQEDLITVDEALGLVAEAIVNTIELTND
jgi:hypothetical protein